MEAKGLAIGGDRCRLACLLMLKVFTFERQLPWRPYSFCDAHFGLHIELDQLDNKQHRDLRRVNNGGISFFLLHTDTHRLSDVL